MFSWHVIELPILKLRRRFSFVAAARIQALEPVAGMAPPTNPSAALQTAGMVGRVRATSDVRVR